MRVAGVAVVVVVLLSGGGAGAGAQPSSSPPPGPVTITLTAEQVSWLCQQRLPRLRSRATRLVERINGGADVRGSVAWLKEKAARERQAGRETAAGLLEQRAARRADQVAKLDRISSWADGFASAHC
jgi:hypothetical protein